MTSISAQILDQRVQRIVADTKEALIQEAGIKDEDGSLNSAAFVLLVTKTVLALTDDEVIDCLVDGGNDFGVDAIYFSPVQDNEFNITLIQGKYKKSLNADSNFPENDVKNMVLAVGALFDPGREITVNSRLRQKLEEIRSFVADGALPTVHVILCNNGLSWTEAAQQHIDAAKFGSQVTWQHIGPDDLVSMLRSTQPVSETLQLTGKFTVENFAFRRVLVGRMAVGQLSSLLDRHGDRLLERNIRRYLGLTGNRVNEAVAGTLRSEEQRQNFYFYNNGITIICSQFRHNALLAENTAVQLEGLQIVNGGQTSKTVQQVARELGPSVADAQVLVRIYELPQDDSNFVQSITYATNSQNPVDLRDLRSNDRKQRELAQALSEMGYQYRSQRSDLPVSTRELTSAAVAEAVLAVWRRRPHQARFNVSEHFGKLYDVIFSEDLNGAQVVAASLIWRYTENRRRRPPADAPDFLPYATRFIAMMIGESLLKTMGIQLRNLNHRNFAQAEKIIEQSSDQLFQDASNRIEQELNKIFAQQDRTLQRLSATFRRGDLIETLTGQPVTAPTMFTLDELGL
ncbi:hypothetical protein GCM10011611_25350 [Aliidongia dinghuensis]|uniref:Abortive phage infection protein C-terminal domain-containing protein n=1 Tax=Aliidongia dinghuensis TaxID=1867774 RepID=A0A8J3E270_9PROT|nr:AIPR family protein [Aliidongia dinghuensis]GGF18382.1 hypothetical protein GCM10011611_25350 [Aliidongia dinghuensis]